MSVTWRGTVKAITKAGRFSQASLAEKAGLYPMALTRYLRRPGSNGAYTPNSECVRGINRAAALLTGQREIASYLTVLALLEGLLPPRTGDLTLEALQAFVKHLDPYFEGGARLAVASAWKELGDPERQGILAGLTVARGDELVRRLEGKPRRSSSLATFLRVFDDAGASLDLALRRDETVLKRFARDRFEAHASEALGALDVAPEERIETARAVLNAFDEALRFVLSPDAINLLYLNKFQSEIHNFLSCYAPKPSRRATKESSHGRLQKA